MKKTRIISAISLILALIFCFSSCEIWDVIKNELDKLHEHSWENWVYSYGETDIYVTCTVCGENVIAYPVSEGLVIEDGVLTGVGTCTDEYVVIPYGVTAIGDSAFKDCASAKGILMPNTVETIGASAFENCTSLYVINLPNGIKSIGERAFYGCSALVGVFLPSGIEIIGDRAFGGCEKLHDFYFDGDEEAWEKVDKHGDWNKDSNHHDMHHGSHGHGGDGHHGDRDNHGGKHEGDEPGGNKPDEHEHTWSDWTVVIEPTYEDKGIKEKYCLTCGKCKTKDVDVLLTPTKGFKFELNEDGTGYILYAIEEAEDGVVVIPSTYEGLPVTHIGDSVGLACDVVVKKIYIPDSVITIGVNAFHMWESLEFVKLGDSITTIQEGAFLRCSSLKSIEIPDSVIAIDSSAFYECFALESVTFEEDSELKNIYQNAFGNCHSLKSIELPDSLENIYAYAFQNCFLLENVVLSSKLNGLGFHAFSYCYNLSEIYIPASVTKIEDGAFFDCESLINIRVDKNNTYYKAVDGNLYTIDGKTLMQYALGKNDETFVIPDYVTYISERAFCGALSLSNIESGNNKNYASINGNLYSKDKKALLVYPAGKKDSTLLIPDFVNKINTHSLYKCYYLLSITIPASVVQIGPWVITNCSYIQELIYTGTVEQWNKVNVDDLWCNVLIPGGIICTNGTVSIN